jgi:Spy/CpxP family protein refolding chaperone
MRLQIKLFLCLTVSLASASITLNGCHSYPKSMNDRAAWMEKRIQSYLDLDDIQRVKLRSLKLEFLNQNEARRSERDRINQQIKELILSPSLDTQKLNSIIGKKNELMSNPNPSLLSKLADFHNSLTPEQRQRIAKKLDEWNES